jgi:hypothetical protein
MTAFQLAFYIGVACVFGISATRAVYVGLREERHDYAIIYTMIAVLSIFVLLNYD